MNTTPEITRPRLSDPAGAATADTVARALAAELQDGGTRADADRYDSSFAADILWGTPFGATVHGYDTLNAIHHGLMAQGAAPESRFEVVASFTPSPGIVVCQIRRQAVDPGGFSEVALYVLAERDGRWWLAAAQNTPVDPARGGGRVSG
ncbi:nuclear transport factor 2 family protein [Nocardia thailandica]